jgi:signal transduction histidine kinase
VWVRADPQQLKQVLINLVQNAAESIGREGIITLRVSGEEAWFANEQKPAAVLAITDTGKGIPKEVQKRLFDPFFTTKDGGTGLGLPTAARIVEKHGGELRYETHPTRGTTFEVVLPRVIDHES